MKIKMLATELLDSSIEFVSLVKNGAIRAPFKILKSEDSLMRQRKKDEILAKRDAPRIVGSGYQRARQAAQRAADVGCAFLKAAPISGDTDEMDPQPGRYGSDPLRADRPAERGFWEQFSALGQHLKEVAEMLRRSGQAEAADALLQAVSNIAKAGKVTKEEQELLFSISSRYSGSRDLDWLEDQGRQMQERNAALVADRSLSSLNESLTASPRDVGVKKADASNDVLDSAYDAGMGVSGKYR